MYLNDDELNERKKIILRAIIDAHISNGEPVGSKYLAQNKQITLSSATIRNEMAELEEMGYLEQPHTSAGRVPSELGYRFYVDSLMKQYNLTSNELNELNALLRSKMAELDKILDNASKLISMFTNYTSLSVTPKPVVVVIMRFDTMLLDLRNFILVMITNTEVIKTKYIHISFDVNEEVLSKLNNVLNNSLVGITMDKITLPLIMEMEKRLENYDMLINPIIKSIYEIVNEIDGGELKFEGVNRLLLYPEYADIERLKNLFNLFEKKDDILNIVANAKKDKINIYIGSENLVDIMNDSTLIFKTISAGGRVIGAIGVIGPCRMDYSKVITTVDYLSRSISNMLTESSEDGGNNDK